MIERKEIAISFPQSTEPGAPAANYMDLWELECAVTLHTEYGHNWGVSCGLAALSRSLLQESLSKPFTPLVVTI